MTCLAEGRWEEARRDFDARMREGGDAARLAGGWARTVGMIGRYEGMGDRSPTGPAIAPWSSSAGFEAGEATGRVIFDDDGKVAGLWLRPASP